MRRFIALFASGLGHRLWAPLALLVVAALALIPDCGSPGLWEPQELAVADRAVARVDAERGAAAAPAAAADDKPAAKASRSCKDAPDADGDGEPDPGGARSLTDSAATLGFSWLGTDRGMRLPLELLGLLTVLAAAGVAYRLRGPRAALLAGLVCLSFPLLALQSRQLTSEIGTAAGGALLVYGLAFVLRPAPGKWAILDGAVAALAAGLGGWLGFLGGGALLGLLVPLAAFALACGGGLPALAAGYRLMVHGLRRLADGSSGRSPARFVLFPFALLPARTTRSAADAMGMPARRLVQHVGVLAVSIVAVLVFARLASQTYDIREPVPGSRQLAGHSIIPSDCYSTALGGVWKFEDNLKVLADAGMPQIAVGTYPWGILAPIAIGLLLMAVSWRDRAIGRLTAAWAGLAWLCTALFLRKVGFALYAGFPAMAIAIGVWLDLAMGPSATAGSPQDESPEPPAAARRGAHLLAIVFFALGVLVLAKDFVAFPDEITTLLTDIDVNTKEAKVYPKGASIAGLPAKLVIAAMGVALVALVLLALLPVDDRSPLARVRRGARLMLVPATALIAITWTHGWHRGLSKVLSSKQVFSTFASLRQDGDVLGIKGKLGNAPRYYDAGDFVELKSNEAVVNFLQDTPGRAFAMIPLTDLCGVHRTAAGKPYTVLDYSSARSILLSNRADGHRDENPLATRIVRQEPTALIQERPPQPIVFDNKIEVVGWTLPKRLARGSEFQMRVVYKVRDKANIGATWKVFVHFDGRGARFQGDHDPIDGVCATSWWQPGDYVIDTFTVEAGDRATPSGPHDVRIGFFTGTNPNWRNMKVSAAPPGAQDDNDRVKLTTVVVQ